MPKPTIEPNLPPAGHKRDEELKIREDALQQKAEEQAAALNVETIHPDKLKLESELVSQFDMLTVSNALPDYEYRWVNADAQHGVQVKMKLAQRGWEVVNGDKPEAKDCRDVTGTARIGDVILMRIHKDLYKQYEERDRQRREAVQTGVTSNLIEMGQKYARHGVVVHYDPNKMPEHIRRAVMKPGESSITGFRGMQAAQQKFESALREGTLQGVTP